MTSPLTADLPRILVVDDDPGFLRTLQILLEDDGAYRVETAGAGEEALARLAEYPGIRVVITDISMPGMDGWQLLGELQRRRGNLPVIMMTAHAAHLGAREAREAGAFRFLTKPIDPEQLLEAISSAEKQAQTPSKG